MRTYNVKYTLFAFLAACVALTSCIYDEYALEKDTPDFTEGYSLNLAVTLDNMGGTRADANPLQSLENYIDPEKFRVLFFDSNDEFLFESKSRWIKELAPNNKGSQWLVSIPMYSYGNDASYDWKWDKIRTALTSGPFKIAILANRPEREALPELEDNRYGDLKHFNNAGPFWNENNTVWGADTKKVFDLLHCQWDPIYENKGRPTANSGRDAWQGENFYAFIMGTQVGEGNVTERTMSATSSWVDFGENLDDQNNKHGTYSSRRYFKRLTKDYPIPMYGIQQFAKIENWVEGTPFNLSSLTEGTEGIQGTYAYKSIALLRSVVKLELLIPKRLSTGAVIEKSDISFIALRYCNIYARCEPMDVWTPTDQLWKDDHDVSTECEWFRIRQFGRIVRNGDPRGNITDADGQGQLYNAGSFKSFRERIAWFYGAWLDKDWSFGTLGQDIVRNTKTTTRLDYPRLFNPITQRNLTVMCDKVDYSDLYNDNYYHYVVYTGERNVNDPNKLYDLGSGAETSSTSSSDPTVGYWSVRIGNYIYQLPLTDYSQNNPVRNHVSAILASSVTTALDEYNSPGITQYFTAMAKQTNTDYLPWPLMRNHVYRITIGGISTRAGEEDELFVSSEEYHSDSI